jgi:nucleotide sugar dehydrogenase
MRLSEELLAGTKRIAVWGTGYIGYSTMAAFASKGVRCLGTDIKKEIVDEINNGQIPIPNLEYWLGYDPTVYVRAGLIRTTTKWEDLMAESFPVHFICVPTESGDEPSTAALADVVRKIANYRNLPKPLLMIVESTLTPGTTDRLVLPELRKAGLKIGADVEVGVAPRRDWFGTSDKNLYNLPRVVGGTDPQTTERIIDVLKIVCNRVLPARDHRHAELVKSIENAYRHVEITLANQLSRAYPDLDMTEILELVGTKWNVGTYHPSLGCGGYCIPLSSKYVLNGTKNKSELSILQETIETDAEQPLIVADNIAHLGCKKVGILGLCYKGDLKVHVLSPTLSMCRHFRKLGIEVNVQDPYYSKEEIMNIAGVTTFTFPDDLDKFDAIIIVSGHRQYRTIPRDELVKRLRNVRIVLDNMEEIWAAYDLRRLGIPYYVTGEPGWLLTIEKEQITKSS